MIDEEKLAEAEKLPFPGYDIKQSMLLRALAVNNDLLLQFAVKSFAASFSAAPDSHRAALTNISEQLSDSQEAILAAVQGLMAPDKLERIKEELVEERERREKAERTCDALRDTDIPALQVAENQRDAARAEVERLKAELSMCQGGMNHNARQARELAEGLDVALKERDAARAEVERLKAELAAERERAENISKHQILCREERDAARAEVEKLKAELGAVRAELAEEYSRRRHDEKKLASACVEVEKLKAELGEAQNAAYGGQALVDQLREEPAAEREKHHASARDVSRAFPILTLTKELAAERERYEALRVTGREFAEKCDRLEEELAAERQKRSHLQTLHDKHAAQVDIEAQNAAQWKERAEKAEANAAVCHCGQHLHDHGFDNHSPVEMQPTCPFQTERDAARAEVERLKAELGMERMWRKKAEASAAVCHCGTYVHAHTEGDNHAPVEMREECPNEKYRAQAAKLAGLLRDWLVKYEKGKAPDGLTLTDTREALREFHAAMNYDTRIQHHNKGCLIGEVLKETK